MMLVCAVCGEHRFNQEDPIPPALVEDWALSAEEAEYIRRQQGLRCTACGSNLRSILLARVLCRLNGSPGPLKDHPPRGRVLEINEAGDLHPYLNSTLASFPEVDMQALPYPDAAFDLVVHSDTLEHVPDPIQGLRECRRVLRPGGLCVFTIPIIVGRMTTDRRDKPESWHGQPGENLVITEYGADAWTHVARAGFRNVLTEWLLYPSATVMVASR